MSTILTHQIVSNANASVDTYIGTVSGYTQSLTDLINGLTAAGFQGDAANGFKDFYNTKVIPAIQTNLWESGDSLTASIKSIMTTIGEQLMDTVDPQLGDVNRNPSQG